MSLPFLVGTTVHQVPLDKLKWAFIEGFLRIRDKYIFLMCRPKVYGNFIDKESDSSCHKSLIFINVCQ